jgi:hypothetical protein
MGSYRNPNYRQLVDAVEEMRGQVLRARAGRKHFLVFVRTPKGNQIRVALSKGPMKAGFVRTWIRQQINRADSGNLGGYIK